MALPNITDGQIAIDPVNRIFYYLDSNGNLVNASLNLLQDSSTQISTEEDLVVSGNLRITGNTTIFESTVTTIKDPIITLGGNTAPTTDDNKDRGIEFRWHNGTSSKLGFFGFDDSSGKFTFIPDATNTSEVFTGSIGELAAKIDWDNVLNKPTFVNSITGTANEVDVSTSTGTIVISLPTTINVNITGTAAGWTTPRKITLGGDLNGEVLIDGGSNVTLNANVIANSIALGTDTTGDYVANVTAGTGITITNGTGEQSQPTIGVTPNTYDAYGAAAAAESNAAGDASTKAAAAYNNALTHVGIQLSTFGVDNLADVTINTSLVNSYLKYNGSAWVNDAVDLATDTTGNYVQSLVAGTGILITNNSGEGATPTISANITLNDLTDVNASLPANGQVLFYDGPTSSWIPKSTAELEIPSAVQYSQLIGDGTSTEFTITHGFITTEPTVIVLKKNASNNFEAVNALWEILSNTQIKVYFETPPTTSNAKVVVLADVTTASVVVSSLDQLSDVITSGSSTGDVLYKDGANWISKSLYLNDLADVAGTNTATPNHYLKYNGSAWVGDVIPTDSLNDLSDVVITSATNGQLLQYDGTNWVNSSPPTGEPTGFENKNDSTISLSTRTFTIAPVSGSYTIWSKGVRYVKTGSLSTTIADTSGLHYIYFNTSGQLVNKMTYFDLENDAPVAYIYWNQGNNTHHFFADERHGIVMDWATHEYLHRTRGAAIASGFGMTATTGGNGTSNTHAQISIANGTFFDEDLEVAITHSATPASNTWQQRIQSPGYFPVFYRSGSAWVKDAATEYPMKYTSTQRTEYNLNTAGTWSTTQISNNRWGITWIVATNNLNEPIIAILGQEEFISSNLAEDSAWEDLDLSGFPIYEFRPLHKIVYFTSNTYTNAPKTALVSVWDYRTIFSTAGAVPSTPVNDHGSMIGLGDNDHPQYLLVADHDSRDHSAALSTAILDDLSDVAITSATPNQFLRYNGSAWVNDLVTLGTNTEGNYMTGVSAGTGISVSHTPGEGSTATVSLNATLNNISNVSISSPVANNIIQYNGTTWVNVLNNLDNLSDVTISSPVANHIVQHNGTTWINTLNNLDNISDVTISGLAAGHVLEYNGSAWVNIIQPTNVDILQVRVFL